LITSHKPDPVFFRELVSDVPELRLVAVRGLARRGADSFGGLRARLRVLELRELREERGRGGLELLAGRSFLLAKPAFREVYLYGAPRCVGVFLCLRCFEVSQFFLEILLLLIGFVAFLLRRF